MGTVFGQAFLAGLGGALLAARMVLQQGLQRLALQLPTQPVLLGLVTAGLHLAKLTGGLVGLLRQMAPLCLERVEQLQRAAVLAHRQRPCGKQGLQLPGLAFEQRQCLGDPRLGALQVGGSLLATRLPIGQLRFGTAYAQAAQRVQLPNGAHPSTLRSARRVSSKPLGSAAS